MRALLITTLILGVTAGGAPAASATEPLYAAALVDRITWGRTAESVSAAKTAGAARWIELQLHSSTSAVLPVAAQAQIDALDITRETMPQIVVRMNAQYKAATSITDQATRLEAMKTYERAMLDLKKQAVTRSLLRNLYSPSQLLEQMTWFWYNHFNVQADKRDIRAMVGDYENTAIRDHALGKFKDLLRAADMHPAMLRYLDNDQNAVGQINENFAREILELHTMGVGSGYTQKDVEEMARILTGVGISLSTEPPRLKPEQRSSYVRRGIFEFNPNRHDFGDKVVLNRKIAGSGLSEYENVLDFLAAQPATAKHISRKIALYFLDDPPTALIDQMTATYLRTDGEISAVLAVLFESDPFKASLGKKLKDPIHYAVSAVRLAYDGRVITNTAPLNNWINRMGQPLYGRETPDGYPIEAAAWSGPGQLTTMFEIARQAGAAPAGFFDSVPAGEKPSETLPQLQNILSNPDLQIKLSETTEKALSQSRSPAEWNILFLSSPEFLHR